MGASFCQAGTLNPRSHHRGQTGRTDPTSGVGVPGPDVGQPALGTGGSGPGLSSLSWEGADRSHRIMFYNYELFQPIDRWV